MLVGAMNHPMQDLARQITLFKSQEFDFIDLTLEPVTEPHRLDAARVKAALDEQAFPAVGHTFWALPIAHPVDAVRDAALGTIEECFRFFACVGVTLVNVHPDERVPMFGPDMILARNVEAFQRLLNVATPLGITVMAENMPGLFSQPAVLQKLFDALPTLTLHLDVGHANLRSDHNTSKEILATLGAKLRHVHLSDNRGGRDDLHLPLGAGYINWRQVIKWLKLARYDSTITLEVFTPDPEYLLLSQRKLRRLWHDIVP